MIKRIYIICEGETEQEFCSTILSSYFQVNNIFISSPIIKKSMGGIVKWLDLKKQIEITLKNDPKAYVTTLIDYYGINEKHNFPNWSIALKEQNKNKRICSLEKGMYEDINEKIRYRFIPYIQLHEFEGLLFNEERFFYEVIPNEDIVGKEELKNTFKNFNNPEMINDNPETAPSKRLKRIITGYNKIIYGNLLAEAIGLDNIRKKSKRFDNWIKKLEKY